jgi:hypothetical protein
MGPARSGAALLVELESLCTSSAMSTCCDWRSEASAQLRAEEFDSVSQRNPRRTGADLELGHIAHIHDAIVKSVRFPPITSQFTSRDSDPSRLVLRVRLKSYNSVETYSAIVRGPIANGDSVQSSTGYT